MELTALYKDYNSFLTDGLKCSVPATAQVNKTKCADFPSRTF